MAAAVAVTTLAVPTAAHAASYNGKCGAGYNVIDSMSITTLGTVYLTYNSATTQNCVVTIRNNPGTYMYMNAAVQLTGLDWTRQYDPGQYSTFAGPVYLYASGKCIDWGGEIGSVYAQQINVHCG
nr:spore-associated protein A [Kitasatospora gansuensis]